MKLVRFGPPGLEQPGVWLDDTPARGQASILNVRAMAFDIEDYDAHFFATGGIARLEGLLAEQGRKLIDATGVRLGPPIARPSKIVCLGKNYADHAKEFDSEIPTTPVLFAKAPSAINGPYDPIVLPDGARTCDVEVELAIVIGKRARRVREADALSCVAGFTILNDVTDRDAQREGRQWFRGKGADTFCPLGPFLVTPDEAGDGSNLRLYSKIDDKLLQDGSTSKFIFPIPHQLAFITATMTLEPGDIVSTGTPGGIGSAQKPPVLLRPGSRVEIGVDRLGAQKNPVVAEAGR